VPEVGDTVTNEVPLGSTLKLVDGELVKVIVCGLGAVPPSV